MAVEIESINVALVSKLPTESAEESWGIDSRFSRLMRPSTDYMVKHLESISVERVIDDCTIPIEDVGKLPIGLVM